MSAPSIFRSVGTLPPASITSVGRTSIMTASVEVAAGTLPGHSRGRTHTPLSSPSPRPAKPDLNTLRLPSGRLPKPRRARLPAREFDP